MTSEIIFKLHLDSHIITQPVRVSHQQEEQLNNTIAQLTGQFSTIGITEKTPDGKLKHFPPHRIQFIEIEMPLVSLADSTQVPSQVKL